MGGGGGSYMLRLQQFLQSGSNDCVCACVACASIHVCKDVFWILYLPNPDFKNLLRKFTFIQVAL